MFKHVYTPGMAAKKRVNITIDSAVHEEMRKFLDLTQSDFSAFVEHMTIRFLGEMRPLIKRMESAQAGESDLSPSEIRVMFLQIMGSVQVETGAQMQTFLSELATIEAEQEKKKLLSDGKSETIHTPKVTKRTKAAPKK